jgi:hypothetical protein
VAVILDDGQLIKMATELVGISGTFDDKIDAPAALGEHTSPPRQRSGTIVTWRIPHCAALRTRTSWTRRPTR